MGNWNNWEVKKLNSRNKVKILGEVMMTKIAGESEIETTEKTGKLFEIVELVKYLGMLIWYG